ncbi:MAG: dihydroorotate dehydrogenase [Gemmatimonadaceae bacterium]
MTVTANSASNATFPTRAFPTPLGVSIVGLHFRNPVLLASGTAGFGRELDDVMDLSAIGGLCTKAVSMSPRVGNPALRVSEFSGGMINAVGLANPGLHAARAEDIPFMHGAHPNTRVLVNIVGNTIEEFSAVVAGLDAQLGIDAFELNVSCPNVEKGGLEFGADPAALLALVRGARRVTSRPLFVKLSPTLGVAIGDSARAAVEGGADALTLINTMPGMVIDVDSRTPKISFGSGGVSGPALLPIGVLATWRVKQAVNVPLVGVGGVSSATEALQYILAGASLVGVGTAALRDPRVPARIVRDLGRWCVTHEISDIARLVGTLQFSR